MAEDIDGGLGIKATIDAEDVQKGADQFVAGITRMQKAAEAASDSMSDGFAFLREQIKTLTDAIEAVRGKLTSISGAMGKVAPVDASSADAYNQLKAQVEALTQTNDALKAKLAETSAAVDANSKAASQAAGSLGEYNSAAAKAEKAAPANASAKAKMKELGDTIKFDKEQIELMTAEYAKLEEQLERLQNKSVRIEAQPVQDDPLAQEGKGAQLDAVNGEIEQTQAKMASLTGLMEEYKGEIASSAQQMSELSNQTGQSGERSVTLRTELRNAKQEVATMLANGQQNTAEFGKAVQRANELQAALKKAGMAVSGKNLAYQSFNLLSQSISGVTGAVSTYMGIAGLFTDDQEKLAAVQKNLQAVMAISMGVQQMLNAATQIGTAWSALKATAVQAVAAAEAKAAGTEAVRTGVQAAETVGTTAATAASWSLATAVKAVSLAIKNIPVIGWILAAVGALISLTVALYNWCTKLSEEEEDARKVNEAYAEQVKKTNETMLGASKAMGESVMKFKELKAEYDKAKNSSKDLNTFIEKNKSGFDSLGVSVSNAAEADRVFAQQTDAVIESLKLRAKAAGAAQAAQDAYAEAFRRQIEAEGWGGAAKQQGAKHYDKDGDLIDEDYYKKEAKRKQGVAQALSDQSMKLADSLFTKSRNLSQQADGTLAKAGIAKAGGANGKKENGGGTGGGGNSGGGKTQAERDWENGRKWREYGVDKTGKYSDKLAELVRYQEENAPDGVKKKYNDIVNEYDNDVKDLAEWLRDIAETRRDTEKETWLNAKDGRTEMQWDKTAAGQMSDKDWDEVILQENPEIKQLYDAYQKAIEDRMNGAISELVDGVLASYDKQGAEKTERLKKLADDISALEGTLFTIQDEAQKKAAQQALARAKADKAWVESDKEAWNEYLSKYGDFLQKRQALDEEFRHDTQGMDESTPEYLTRERKYKDDVSKLVTDEQMSGLNIQKAFGNLAGIQTGVLDGIHEKLLAIIKDNTELNSQDRLKFVEQFQKVSDELGSRKAGLMKGNWLGDTISGVRSAKEQEKAEKAYWDGEIKAKQKEKDEADRQYGAKKGELDDFLKKNTDGSLTSDSLKSMMGADLGDAQTLQQFRQMFQNAGGDWSKMGQQFTQMFQGFQGAGANAAQAAQGLQGAQRGKETAGNGGGTGVAGALTNGLNGNIQSLNALVQKWGDENSSFAKGMGEFAESSQEAVAAVQSLASGDIFGVVLHLANAFESLGNSMAYFFGFDDGMKEWKDAVDRYERLSDVWDDLIDKKKEYIGLSYDIDEVNKEIESVKSLYAAQEKAVANELSTYMARRSSNAHSFGYRINKEVEEAIGGDWNSLYSAIGLNIGTNIENLKDATYEQLLAFKEYKNGEAWGAISSSEARDYLEQLLEIKKAAEDFGDEMQEKVTGITFQTMVDDFMDCLTDMDKGADEFVSNLKKKLRSAIINNLYGQEVQAKIKTITERIQKDQNDGTMTEEKWAAYRDEISTWANDIENRVKETVELIGMQDSSSDESQSGGYASASEESIEELSGRQLATNEALYSIRDILSAAQAETQNALVQMVTIGNANSGYWEQSVELQTTSVEHLANIEKNTAELFGIHEKLTKIEKNTRSL